MSESDGGPGRREVAYRVFAAEFDDADYAYSESDEERAPNYVVTPTGARVNRLFAVGVLTAVESVNESMLRARVVDPTGPFVLYAGQYQPDALAFLERADPPAFVAVTGKARTFEPDDGDQVYTSVRPEVLNEVDAATRDRWVVATGERTIERVATAAGAIQTGLAGDRLRAALESVDVEPGLAAGIPLALAHYGTTPTYLEALRATAVDAARVVAGDLEEVPSRSVAPDATGDVAASELADEAVAAATPPPGVGGDPESSATGPADDEAPTATAGASESVAGSAAADASSPGETGDGSAEGEESARSEPVDDPEAEEPAFDLDEETRQEVAAEHGVEFSTGSEVDEAGAADIEPPSHPDEHAETEDATVETPHGEDPSRDGETSHDAGEDDAAAPTDAADGAGAAATDEGAPADPDDLTEPVLDAMAALDDGEGAERAALVETVAEETGADAAVVRSAVEEALKRGRCYEPEDGRLKRI